MTKTLAILTGLLAGHSAGAEVDSFYMDYYTQTFTVEFADEAAARSARLEILPLYHGYEWAVSSRWDDNIPTDLKMRQTLTAHGYRGTFYMNATRGSYYGPDYDLIASNDYPDLGRRLLAGGNTIGGHTLTHPFLTCQCRNRIFHEVMGIRADREGSTGCPINSFSFPFTEFRNAIEGDVVHQDIAEVLKRAGYYQVVEPGFDRAIGQGFIVANLLPADGQDIDEALGRMVGDWTPQLREPNITFNMHVWYKTPEAWAKFEGQLEKYGHNPRWWHCNQSEYAAYRYQLAHVQLEQRADGKRVRATLKRPVLLDLNNAVPLTFRVRGVSADKVLRVDCSTAKAEPLEPDASGYRFDLPHDRTQALPRRMALLEFDPGEMGLKQHSAFPGLGVRFEPEGDHLRCLLKNGITALRQLRVTWRLPLEYQPGVTRETRSKLGSDETLDLSLPLASSAECDGYKYQSGDAWFYAQLDFIRDGEPGRLHLVCHRPEAGVDAGYPRDGFVVLGPLPDDAGAAEDLAAKLAATTETTNSVTVPGGESRSWQAKDIAVTRLLDPEYICTRGDSHADQPEYYLLRTRLAVERPQTLTVEYGGSRRQAQNTEDGKGKDALTPPLSRPTGEGVRTTAEGMSEAVQVTAMFLNGHRVEQNKLELKEGDNDLLLVYFSGKEKYSARHYGAFLRLIEPAAGKRATTVRYQRP